MEVTVFSFTMILTNKAIVAVLLLHFALTASEQQWTYDLISVASNSTSLSNAEVGLEVVRIARGKYAVNGFLDFKGDLMDDTIVSLEIYRSMTGSDDDYKVTPFRIDGDSLVTFMNTHYKEGLLPTARECATNYPDFEDFQAPLTKRKVEMENCNVPLDGYPDQMSEGKYKIIGSIKNPIYAMNLEIVVFVEEL